VRIGDPLDAKTVLGPLHTEQAIDTYEMAVQTLRKLGSDIIIGGQRCSESNLINGYFVEPTISMPTSTEPTHPIWSTETFAPILNVAVFDDLEQAIEWNNAVPQGLSSSLWTRDIRNVGKWIGPAGSDTGIVNVRVALQLADATATGY
jgi:aldehyde dehydrogenase family 7 protein A1